MAFVKLPRSERSKLIDAINNQESVTVKISSRMIVNPDLGVNGSVKLPLTPTQLAKLSKSQRATSFNLSKTQLKKLMKGGNLFGSLWKGIKSVGKTVAEVVGTTTSKVAPMVLDKLVDGAIAAAPALLMGLGNPPEIKPTGRKIKGTVGVASFRQPTNSLSIKGRGLIGSGGSGGERGSGKMVVMNAPPVVNQNVSSTFFISDT